MPIYHMTDTEMPIEALVTLGVSVKSEGSIGYFGTGFKFAVATLLRNGCRVKVNEREFTAHPTTIRGEEFHIVHLDERPLGFTTDLGRNWQVWMAFRELHSNTLDEGGVTSDRPGEAANTISVFGPAYEEAYHSRHEIFINRPAIVENGAIRIYSAPANYKYYRGVRAGNMERPASFTYNQLAQGSLTEDRTLTSEWYLSRYAAQAFAEDCHDAEVLRDALLPQSPAHFEATFDFGLYNPTELFLDLVHKLRNNPRLNHTALDLLTAKRPETRTPETIELTTAEQRELQQAMNLCAKIGVPRDLPMLFIEAGSGDSLGFVRAGQIHITRRAFDQGYRILAGTIYEEWLHQTKGLRDCTRQMQNYLLDKLIATLDESPKAGPGKTEEEVPF